MLHREHVSTPSFIARLSSHGFHRKCFIAKKSLLDLIMFTSFHILIWYTHWITTKNLFISVKLYEINKHCLIICTFCYSRSETRAMKVKRWRPCDERLRWNMFAIKHLRWIKVVPNNLKSKFIFYSLKSHSK